MNERVKSHNGKSDPSWRCSLLPRAVPRVKDPSSCCSSRCLICDGSPRTRRLPSRNCHPNEHECGLQRRRRRGLESVAGDLPLLEYHAVRDDRTRPAHAALNGMILVADQEVWHDHFPPWGFNCRCTITATDEVLCWLHSLQSRRRSGNLLRQARQPNES